MNKKQMKSNESFFSCACMFSIIYLSVVNYGWRGTAIEVIDLSKEVLTNIPLRKYLRVKRAMEDVKRTSKKVNTLIKQQIKKLINH